jgi:hypothetical protein
MGVVYCLILEIGISELQNPPTRPPLVLAHYVLVCTKPQFRVIASRSSQPEAACTWDAQPPDTIIDLSCGCTAEIFKL